ncbi:hypothetical protein ACRALDRAFT_204831 [Sodiomyces alcalophilus JCM 7366]|uniref:uncharacterized protein n=1 Tax=Sodiomyces alcalophilus JCM 7366 TaxID=591952 RepID=UPI0039B5B0ED
MCSINWFNYFFFLQPADGLIRSRPRSRRDWVPSHRIWVGLTPAPTSTLTRQKRYFDVTGVEDRWIIVKWAAGTGCKNVAC